MNFARLNHILIPDSKEGRDRFRRTRTGKLLRPLFLAYLALTHEGQGLALAWLIFGAAGLEVRSTQIYVLWCLTTGVLLASWAHRRLYRMRGVRAEIRAPPRVTVSETVGLTLSVTNTGDQAFEHIRVVGPLLPWDGKYVGERRGIRGLAPGATAQTLVEARFSHRGEHHLDNFYLGQVLPLGLMVGPAIETDGVRFLVVPRMARIGDLELPRTARYQPGGVTTAGAAGESMEFVGVRPYRPGDRVRDLHARSWARTGYPVVREYRQEYFTRVGVILDTDQAAADERRLEAAIELCAGVVGELSGAGGKSSTEGALIDLLVVGDRVHQLTLGRQLGTLDQAQDLLAVLAPGPAFDPETLGGAITPHLKQLSAVVFVALVWDAARAQVVRDIRDAGTACKVLLVADDPPAGAPETVGVTRVSPAAIAGEAPLLL